MTGRTKLPVATLVVRSAQIKVTLVEPGRRPRDVSELQAYAEVSYSRSITMSTNKSEIERVQATMALHARKLA